MLGSAAGSRASGTEAVHPTGQSLLPQPHQLLSKTLSWGALLRLKPSWGTHTGCFSSQHCRNNFSSFRKTAWIIPPYSGQDDPLLGSNSLYSSCYLTRAGWKSAAQMSLMSLFFNARQYHFAAIISIIDHRSSWNTFCQIVPCYKFL